MKMAEIRKLTTEDLYKKLEENKKELFNLKFASATGSLEKPHRVSYEGKAKGNTVLTQGEYGLMAKEGSYITAQQIEAARIAMTRYMKSFKRGKVFINIFPHLARTKKPAEVRMGSGKGNVEEWAAVVKEGKIMFEMTDVTEEIAREAFRLAGHKLPIKTKFVMKEVAK